MEISHLQLKIHLHSLSIFQLPILESCIFLHSKCYWTAILLSIIQSIPPQQANKHLSKTPQTPKNPRLQGRLQCLARRVVCWTLQNLETKHGGNPRQRWGLENKTGWWLNQPIWEICSSNWVHLPQFSGWKSKIFELPPTRKTLLNNAIFFWNKISELSQISAQTMEKWQKWRPLLIIL